MQERRSSPFGEPGGRRSSWSSKREVTSRPSKKMSSCFEERLLPNIQGVAMEVKGLKVKYLQLNLGRGKEAQNLLRRVDVFLISEQHKWSENSAWYQDASRWAGNLACSPDLSIRDFLVTDAGFVWVELAGVRVYSCYFSPNDPFEKASKGLLGGPLLRATLIVCHASGEKPVCTRGESLLARLSIGMT